MIIYSLQKEILLDSYLGREKLIKAPFDSKVFSDHLSWKHRAKMLFSLLKKNQLTICVNSEATVHSKKYWRPFNLFDFVISHQRTDQKNCFYYSIGTEHILNNNFLDLRDTKRQTIQKDDPIRLNWIVSNYNKVKQNIEKVQSLPIKTMLYGNYGRRIKITRTSDDNQRNFINSAQQTLTNYDAHISIENSNQDGYFSAMPIYSLLSGSVPIIMGSNIIHRTILNPKAYLEVTEAHFSLKEFETEIKKRQSFILTSNFEELFSAVFLEYLNFIKGADVFDFGDIKRSKGFRKALCS